jgi:hypothetical protein
VLSQAKFTLLTPKFGETKGTEVLDMSMTMSFLLFSALQQLNWLVKISRLGCEK